MNKLDITLVYDYNYWANARVLDAAARLQPEQLSAPAAGLSYGSVRGNLAHILGAEWLWRMRCQQGKSPSSTPPESEYPTLEVLRARWADEERAMRAYLAGLGDDDLQQIVRYRTTGGKPYQNPLGQLLLHVVNHGTQHRAEAGVALTAYGQSPGEFDFVVYLRQQPQPS